MNHQVASDSAGAEPRPRALQQLVEMALAEDRAREDATTDFFKGGPRQWRVIARQPGVFCGEGVAREVFLQMGYPFEVVTSVVDGGSFKAGDVLEAYKGDSRMLSVERVILNFLQHLTAVSTHAARFAEAVKGLPCTVLDTRKTTPGWRHLEKHAVAVGGCTPHRMDLASAIMVKDNHWDLAKNPHGDDLVSWIGELKGKKLPLIVEVTSLEDALTAASAQPDVILLDNFSLPELTQAVKEIRSRFSAKTTLLEASGGVTLDSVRAIALTGVDRISTGSLTQNPPRVDLSLEMGS
ncbi:MAG: carboxylating nicotinate-nucleotide diphosphorylase [Planctomycetota bacterium]